LRPEREEDRPLERLEEDEDPELLAPDERDELPLERLTPDERDELPLERLTPDERDELPLERLTPDERDELPLERLTPDERDELPLERLTPDERERVLLLFPTLVPERPVEREGTARLPVVRLGRVVARLFVDPVDRLDPTLERVVRVVVRLPTLVERVVRVVARVVDCVAVRVLPIVVRADPSPVNAPRDGRVPLARPFDAVAPARPLLTTVRVPDIGDVFPNVLRVPAIPSRSRPLRVPRVRLVSALRAIVAPRGANVPEATRTPP